MEESLVKSHGVLLTIKNLAVLLNRSPGGLRVSLRGTNPWVTHINSTRLRLGRRVYFRTSEIAAILAEKESR